MLNILFFVTGECEPLSAIYEDLSLETSLGWTDSRPCLKACKQTDTSKHIHTSTESETGAYMQPDKDVEAVLSGPQSDASTQTTLKRPVKIALKGNDIDICVDTECCQNGL